jgi:hypothetical protein
MRKVLALVAVAAVSCPVQLQIDLSHNVSLSLTKSPAFAKGGNNGGGNGNSGGGNGGGNNGGGNGGGGNAGNGSGKGGGGAGNNGGGGNGGSNAGNGNGGGSGKGGGSAGNNGGGGNGGGNAGNGNGGGKGSGNSGNSRGGGNAGKGNGGSGKSGGNAGNSANGGSAGNGNGGGNAGNAGNGGGRSAGSNAGNNGGQAAGGSGNRGAYGGSGNAAGQAKAPSSRRSVNANGPSATPQPTGLSALFGAIAESFRPTTGPTTVPSPTRARAEVKSARSAKNSNPRDGRASTTAQRQRATVQPVANAALSKPRQASRSIVVTGLTPSGIARLKAQGFTATMQTRGTIAQVARLSLPRGISIENARRAIRVVDASATADLDHYYYTDDGETCTGPTCETASLVGWTPPSAKQCGAIPPVGIIDTRIDVTHEALKGQSIELLSAPRKRGLPSRSDHGTAIASLLVGRANGSAPGLLPSATLLAVDAFYREPGSADRTDVTSLVTALETLAERNVRIVNMSLSGPPNEVLKKAIEAAQTKGMMIIAAAGNNGAGAEPSYPAAYAGVIAVTAVDRSFSIYDRATRGDYVDIAAPGVNLWVAATGKGGNVKSGTSYAVPFVSAAAAVLHASDPAADERSLWMKLATTARDLGEPGRDTTFGNGLIQMAGLCSNSQEAPVAQQTDPAQLSELPQQLN